MDQWHRRDITNVPKSVRKYWNDYELEARVVMSLAIQITLIIFGNRKRTSNVLVRLIVWSAYLSADDMASVSLGIISSLQQQDIKIITVSSRSVVDQHSVIAAFWTPFLLLHLGGVDSITAYSVEDNELWLRHLLDLGFRVGYALYVFSTSYIHTHRQLQLLAIPVFVAGIIKVGERVCALRSASTKHFTTSSIPAPNLNAYYTDAASHSASPESIKIRSGRDTKREHVVEGSYYLHEAFLLYQMLRDIYVDIELDERDLEDSNKIFLEKSPEEAFKLIETEIGFLYDTLYTKAPVIWYLWWGCFLRIFSFLSCISALVLFCLIIDKRDYVSFDITITYLFLVGAVFLEIYSIILLITSDWTMVRLSFINKPWANIVYRTISCPLFSSTKHKTTRKWSGTMGQFNLIGFGIEEKPTICSRALVFFRVYDKLMKKYYTSKQKVSIELKEMIFQQLRDNLQRAKELNVDTKLIQQWRGAEVLKRNNNCLEKFQWSTDNVKFGHSLILWHIATDICYNSDLGRYQKGSNVESICTSSKYLSNYMMYYLLINPFELPRGNGLVTFLETWADTRIFFRSNKTAIQRGGRKECTSLLLKLDNGIRPRSALANGCALARELQNLESSVGMEQQPRQRTIDEKWEMISQVWVDMLCYAAGGCGWTDQADPLRRGGELLTHVAVLMAHLGMVDNY